MTVKKFRVTEATWGTEDIIYAPVYMKDEEIINGVVPMHFGPYTDVSPLGKTEIMPSKFVLVDELYIDIEEAQQQEMEAFNTCPGNWA